MSNRNPDRLAHGYDAPMICVRGYNSKDAPGGPGEGPHCFFFGCGGCMMYPRLRKSWELTDMERGRCLLPQPRARIGCEADAPNSPSRTEAIKIWNRRPKTQGEAKIIIDDDDVTT